MFYSKHYPHPGPGDRLLYLWWHCGIDTSWDCFGNSWQEFALRSLDDGLGDAWMQGIHPDDFDQFITAFWEAFRERKSFEVEFRLRRLDGEYRWILTKGIALIDATGDFSGYFLLGDDVTERKRGEEPLRTGHLELAKCVIEQTREIAKVSEELQTEIVRRQTAERGLRESFEKLQRVLQGATEAISQTMEMRDPYTASHDRRVAGLAAAIAKEMGMSEEKIHVINLAAMVHDIGKICLPVEILTKPGRLTEIEFALVRGHSQAGYDILKGIEFPWPIAEIVRQHHENVDGSGYPQGLRGENILPEARVLAVADVVEAMASHRPYRPALGMDQVLKEIKQNRDVLYDSAAVDACLRLLEQGNSKFESFVEASALPSRKNGET